MMIRQSLFARFLLFFVSTFLLCTILFYSCVYDKIEKPAPLESMMLRPHDLTLSVEESAAVRIITTPNGHADKYAFYVEFPEEDNIITAEIIEQGNALKITALAVGEALLVLRAKANETVQATMYIRVLGDEN